MESPTAELEEGVGGVDKSMELDGGKDVETSDLLETPASPQAYSLGDLVSFSHCFYSLYCCIF